MTSKTHFQASQRSGGNRVSPGSRIVTKGPPSQNSESSEWGNALPISKGGFAVRVDPGTKALQRLEASDRAYEAWKTLVENSIFPDSDDDY